MLDEKVACDERTVGGLRTGGGRRNRCDAGERLGARVSAIDATVRSVSGSTENIEAVARTIFAKALAQDGEGDEKLTGEVDVYWHIVAAELEAGPIDETGEYVGGLDWSRKMEAYRDWIRRHPESREAWEVVWEGTMPDATDGRRKGG